MTKEEIQTAYVNLAARRGDLAFQESNLTAQIATVKAAILDVEAKHVALQKAAAEPTPAVQEGSTNAVAAPAPND